MDSFVTETDFYLLQNDKYTFFVLARILHGNCNFVASNHKTFIICHSCEPFPLWIINKIRWELAHIRIFVFENIARQRGHEQDACVLRMSTLVFTLEGYTFKTSYRLHFVVLN